VPVITVTHGRTLGAGCIIACLGNIALGPEDLTFGFPEMRFGLYPVFVHAALCERIPTTLAFQLCIGGRLLGADEAWQHGLLTERLPAAGFSDAAEARIAHYAERLDALAIGRRIRRQSLPRPMAERMALLGPLLVENHGAPSTRRLLADMPFARA
jgi:enoyl-CoA hydratase